MALSRDQIITTAVDILTRYGLADLSMRRLARELDVQPGALYWHVANKQELLVEVADVLLYLIQLASALGIDPIARLVVLPTIVPTAKITPAAASCAQAGSGRAHQAGGGAADAVRLSVNLNSSCASGGVQADSCCRVPDNAATSPAHDEQTARWAATCARSPASPSS